MKKSIRTLAFVVLLVALASAVTFTALNRVAITNSKVDSTAVGATTPSTGAFTSLASTSGASHVLTPCTFDSTGTSTGTAAFVSIYSCTVPASTITNGQSLRVTASYTSGSVTACSSQLLFGTLTLNGAVSQSMQNGNQFLATIKNANASQTVQTGFATTIAAASIENTTQAAGTVNTAASQTLAFQISCPGTVTTIAGLGMVTEVLQ